MYRWIDITNGADVVMIQRNTIGTELSGSTALPNGSDGIAIESAGIVMIAWTEAGSGNLIPRNGDNGIEIGNAAPPTKILIQRNSIGPDASATWGYRMMTKLWSFQPSESRMAGRMPGRSRRLFGMESSWCRFWRICSRSLRKGKLHIYANLQQNCRFA